MRSNCYEKYLGNTVCKAWGLAGLTWERSKSKIMQAREREWTQSVLRIGQTELKMLLGQVGIPVWSSEGIAITVDRHYFQEVTSIGREGRVKLCKWLEETLVGMLTENRLKTKPREKPSVYSARGKNDPVEDPEKESRGVEGEPGKSESWMPKW